MASAAPPVSSKQNVESPSESQPAIVPPPEPATEPTDLLTASVTIPNDQKARRTSLTEETAIKHFKYIVVGGGNASGYVAREFVNLGVEKHELLIFTEEGAVAYERPALSKGFMVPEVGSKLPGFYTCAGGGTAKQDPLWYSDNGIEYWTSTKANTVDLERKRIMLRTAAVNGVHCVTYDTLIIATGMRARMADVANTDLTHICHCRHVVDAEKIVNAIRYCQSIDGQCVVVGGGFLGLEIAAAVAANKVQVTWAFQGDRVLRHLFTPEMSEFYEKFYEAKGVKILRQRNLEAFNGEGGLVKEVNFIGPDGPESIPADMVVMGLGAEPNTDLFVGQLDIVPGVGIKVDGHFRTSVPGVYAIGDVAAFPVKMYGGIVQRQEHVVNCRLSAAHVVQHIKGVASEEYDYLPYFYSRMFNLSWQVYGNPRGEAVHFDVDLALNKFGAYWVYQGYVVAAFLESGAADEVAAIKLVARDRPEAPPHVELRHQGIQWALDYQQKVAEAEGKA